MVVVDSRVSDQKNKECVADQVAALMQGRFVPVNKKLEFADEVVGKEEVIVGGIAKASVMEIFADQLELLVA